ncbi:MAG: tryptophan synthase subunit alpha [candidate division NC10 bacterium]|nr:tryptophan synthase subunit alpha [candidate division NC10 bacterium]
MNRIDETFARLKEKGKRALIPFITAGDPDFGTTRELAWEFEERGADILELGVPFSDPLADGKTIQKASQRALERGATLRKILGLVEEIRSSASIPLVLMSYYNPILRYGLKEFSRDASSAGMDGLIVPDLPPEEAEPLLRADEAHGVDTIFLLAPTSPEARISLISKLSQGYIYYVSLRGVTGARAELVPDLASAVARIRPYTEKPIAVGFGISTPEQAREVALYSDGVIVGSAIVNQIERHLGQRDLITLVGDFLASMKRAIEGLPFDN